MLDNMAWGAEACKRVGSDRVKILYDIYHAQIMEGDIIRTLRANKDYIGHYHTGGNPGRNEIDDTQELYYPAIMKAIAETGYTGYVAHEFVPKTGPAGVADLRDTHLRRLTGHPGRPSMTQGLTPGPPTEAALSLGSRSLCRTTANMV